MLAFLGGTGPEGRGLALRLAMAGHEVLIGSRDPAKAQDAARRIKAKVPQARVTGVDNSAAASQGEVVFVTVPYSAQKPLLSQLGPQLEGKLVVDVVAPVEFVGGKIRAVSVEEGSAALEAARLLPRSTVVAAFQNISASDLLVPDRAVEGDVVVCGDDAQAKRRVMEMTPLIKNLRAVDGGGLENARYVEDLTALLMNINKLYKCHSMIKIVGV